MRQKLRYTPAQIETALYTTGKEWQLADGTEYVGLYHRYTTGEVFTEAAWNPQKSKPLHKYEEIAEAVKQYKQLNDVSVQFDSIVTYRPQITTQTEITRYFIGKLNEYNIKEIDETQYARFGSGQVDNIIYATVSVNWKVAGEVRTTTTNGVTSAGVFDHNLAEIRRAKTILPDIDRYLTDPLELLTDQTYLVPRDINQ